MKYGCVFAVSLLLAMLVSLSALAQDQVPGPAPLEDSPVSQSRGGSMDMDSMDTPEVLGQWADWVLHGYEQGLCPPQWNDAGARRCAYPSSLELDLASGEFAQKWTLFAEQTVLLPSVPDGLWPGDVLVDNEPAMVVDVWGEPGVLLPPGTFEITGTLHWEDKPELLNIPPDTALIRLRENGRDVAVQELTADGLLRLGRPQVVERAEDRHQVRLFRLVRDARPMEIVTLIRLDVSGRDRAIELENVLPTDSTPLYVDSYLDLSFTPGQSVLVQARAGRHEIMVTSRMDGLVTELGPLETPFGQEFWSFEAVREVRVAEVRSVPAVDPQTTDIPVDWQHLPAYLVEDGAVMAFEELHRGGLTQSPDQLSLSRVLWLDHDGQGLTAQDEVWGDVRRQWTLTMSRPGDLGRVTMDGVDQAVVLLGEEQLPGVELRNGWVSLSAESRYEDFRSALPSSGWERDFQEVSASLNLPPGWRLVAATGVDSVSDSWISRWNLLDIFLVLIISLAVFRLRSPLFGILALVFLVTGFHEPGAPRYTWLFLLGVLALLHLFAQSERFKKWLWIKRSLLGLYLLILLVMAVFAIPFIFNQFRHGIYPQLEPTYSYGYSYSTRSSTVQYDYAPEPAMAPGGGGEGAYYGDEVYPESEEMAMQAPDDKSGITSGFDRQVQAQFTYDPEALVQTGPGLPRWDWRSVDLGWNGPVEQGQELKLWLLPPWATMLLSFARGILLLAVLVALADIRKHLKAIDASPQDSGAAFSARPGAPVAATMIALFVLAMGTLLTASPTPAQAQDNFPPQYMLDELRSRLLEPDACFPHCVSSPSLDVTLTDSGLTLVMNVHAAAQTSVPLPVVSEGWQASTVLVNEEPAQAMYRNEQGVWVLVEPGASRIVVTGPAPEVDVFQISLPLLPNQGSITARGWDVQGLGQGGRLEGALRLARVVETPVQEQEGDTLSVPAFLHVERRLELGLEWEVITTVSRITPPGEAVLMEIPLLDGESVLTEGMEVTDNKILVRMEQNESSAAWRSRLAMGGTIELTAPGGVDWVETWLLNASSIWDITLDGAPLARNMDDFGAWQPLWRPWPGETASIAVTRPETAPGETLTIDEVNYTLVPGSRLDENSLQMTIRAAKGGRHTLTLPPGAEVQELFVGGIELPRIGDSPEQVDITLSPGVQDVYLTWRQSRDSSLVIGAPEVDLGHAAVNIDMVYEMPDNRWILSIWGGPVMGPAVRFWTYLAALVLVAAVLGSIPYTPLKRWQWFLLALGMAQIGPVLALFTVLWLFALGAKQKHYPHEGWIVYNLMQVGLWLLALLGLSCLALAITRGLLDPPGMQIAGNSSYDTWLHWTQDRIDKTLPQPMVLSVPVIWYRIVMLLWSLWLAFSLLQWLKWAWTCINEGGLMRGFNSESKMEEGTVTATE
ncbi:MAG: hypothetical protein D6E12_07600 [Desulfovibrio sp.]|nr:MAG: hypothetical protein D6E12_07600 [Desulfovibrio sp.]